MSPMLRPKGPTGLPTRVLLFGIGAIVGGLLTTPTVNRNESLAVRLPSLTVIVIVLEPLWPVAGVILSVRLPPDPPKANPLVGTRVGLLAMAETVKAPAPLSTSLT